MTDRELPAPAFVIEVNDEPNIQVYTADQMRAYAEAAIKHEREANAVRLNWIYRQHDEFSCGEIHDVSYKVGHIYVHGMDDTYGEGKTFTEALDAAIRARSEDREGS